MIHMVDIQNYTEHDLSIRLGDPTGDVVLKSRARLLVEPRLGAEQLLQVDVEPGNVSLSGWIRKECTLGTPHYLYPRELEPGEDETENHSSDSYLLAITNRNPHSITLEVGISGDFMELASGDRFEFDPDIDTNERLELAVELERILIWGGGFISFNDAATPNRE